MLVHEVETSEKQELKSCTKIDVVAEGEVQSHLGKVMLSRDNA
jgi:hypothetical protein